MSSGNGVMVGDTTHSGVMSMKTLTFSPICTSHQGTYSCQAIIDIPSIVLKTANSSRFISIYNPCKLLSMRHKSPSFCVKYTFFLCSASSYSLYQ